MFFYTKIETIIGIKKGIIAALFVNFILHVELLDDGYFMKLRKRYYSLQEIQCLLCKEHLSNIVDDDA